MFRPSRHSVDVYRHANYKLHVQAVSSRTQHFAYLTNMTIQQRDFSGSGGALSSQIQPSIREKLPKPQDAKFRLREFELVNRVFLVTGGGQGLGLTLAEALVEAGGQVYCFDRREKPDDEFTKVQKELAPTYGGALHYERLDVRNAEDISEAVSRIASKHQRLDGLVAAAGVQNVKPALEFTPEEINTLMDVNYKGVYLAAQACAKEMVKYKIPGSMLLIASMSGLIANKGFNTAVYNSSKAAVIQLTRSLAMEFGQIIDGKPIRVNALCPGNILTPMVMKNFQDDPSLEEEWKRQNMLGRISEPNEYRGAALFTLSDASSFMTGSSLVVDGGYTAWGG